MWTMAGMDRREQVRRWLARRERRGLTFRELSAETGVPVGTLAHWSWRLRQEETDHPPRPRKRAAFVELVEDRPVPRSRIEVVVRGDRRVIVEEDVDAELLARVVSALERC